MLSHLHIENFKGFEQLDIGQLARVNLITGKNNTGKTSLLEAIYMYRSRGLYFALQYILRQRDSVYALDSRAESEKISFGSLFGKDSKPIVLAGKGQDADLRLTLQWVFKKDGSEEPLSPEDQDIGVPYRTYLQAKINDRKLYDYELGSRAFGQTFAGRRDVQYLPSSFSSEGRDSEGNRWDEGLARDWDSLYEAGREGVVLEFIRHILPNAKDINFNLLNHSDQRVPMVGLEGRQGRIPLRQMGEGTIRLLNLGIRMALASGGLLLIDEFENGLHYSVQPMIWEQLFRIARELNVQVFATTHSRDCVEAFARAANLPENEGNARLVRLYRNRYESIGEVDFDAETVKAAVEGDIEMR